MKRVRVLFFFFPRVYLFYPCELTIARKNREDIARCIGGEISARGANKYGRN